MNAPGRGGGVFECSRGKLSFKKQIFECSSVGTIDRPTVTQPSSGNERCLIAMHLDGPICSS